MCFLDLSNLRGFYDWRPFDIQSWRRGTSKLCFYCHGIIAVDGFLVNIICAREQVIPVTNIASSSYYFVFSQCSLYTNSFLLRFRLLIFWGLQSQNDLPMHRSLNSFWRMLMSCNILNYVWIFHFIGSPKPWQALEVSTFQTPIAREHFGKWDIFINQVLPHLTLDMVCCLSHVSYLPVCSPTSNLDWHYFYFPDFLPY